MGANVDLDQRLTGPVPHEWAGLSRMGRGLRAVVGMVLPHPHGDLSLSLGILSQGESLGMEGLGFLTKELPCGCIFTLQDMATKQLSVDIDKVKCDLEAFYNVKIGCESNHLSYCSKTA